MQNELDGEEGEEKEYEINEYTSRNEKRRRDSLERTDRIKEIEMERIKQDVNESRLVMNEVLFKLGGLERKMSTQTHQVVEEQNEQQKRKNASRTKTRKEKEYSFCPLPTYNRENFLY